jgi:hypothetical protein
MPTFIFYRNRAKLDSCQGADPVGLESKIQHFYGSGETDDFEGLISGHVWRLDNLYYHILGMIFLILIILFWKNL